MKPATIRGWCLIPLMTALALSSCRKGSESADSELQEAGYALTAPDWMQACAAGDPLVVRRFLDAGFEIETRDAAGDTGAHAAATAGRIEVLEFLLNRKLPVDIAGANQRTPLMAAVLADQPDTVRWLLRQGADAKAKDGNGFSPIMLAVREGHAAVVEELCGASPDQLDDALLLASLIGQSGVIDPLTSHGASVFARMKDGRTPLMLAAQNGHLETTEMLLELGSSRYSTAEDGRTAANFASDGGFPDIQMIIENTTRDVAIGLDGNDEVIQTMSAYVDHVAGNDSPEATITDEPVVLLDGAEVSTPVAAAGGSAAPPPLVMRHYQQRELPIRIAKVEGSRANLEIARGETREIEVESGQLIPETTLEVVRVYKRVEHGKLNDGNPIEIAVIDVRDTRTGATRSWLAGQPAGAHEPAALVEDATTGRRYLAVQGQRFTAPDGSTFVVSDVRPNQLVITEEATGTPHTLPLRGPRG